MGDVLSLNERELLKQAGGKIGHPNYGDRDGIQRDIASLVRRGLIYRTFEDDQPTAYTTPAGDAEVKRILKLEAEFQRAARAPSNGS